MENAIKSQYKCTNESFVEKGIYYARRGILSVSTVSFTWIFITFGNRI